jgi:hypothetical protein
LVVADPNCLGVRGRCELTGDPDRRGASQVVAIGMLVDVAEGHSRLEHCDGHGDEYEQVVSVRLERVDDYERAVSNVQHEVEVHYSGV